MIRSKSRKKLSDYIFPLLIFIVAIVMSIGYAAINSITLDIEGSAYAKLQEGIFITDIVYYNHSDAAYEQSVNDKFFGTVVNSHITLGENLDSSISYKITLYNSSKSVYTFMGLNYDNYFYSNPDIKTTITGLNVGDKVLGKSYVELYMNFSYADGVTTINNSYLEAYLMLLFDKFPPEFTVMGNPLNYVNSDVTLEIVPANEIPTDVYEYSFDGGNTWQANPTKTYSENTDNIQILIRDFDGVTSNTYTTSIDKIDKMAPTIYIDPSYIDNTIITLGDSYVIKDFIVVDDDLSGINESAYIITRNDGSLLTNTTQFPTAGYYNMNIYLEDNAGNISTASWKILVRWPTGAKYVLSQQNVISTGSGLYADNADTGLDPSLPFTSTHYYVGKEVNNYINFSGEQFRIISLSQNNTVKLIGGSAGRYRYVPNGFVTNNRFYSSDNTIRKNLQSWAETGTLDDITVDLNHIEKGIFYVGGIDKGDRNTLADEIHDERTNTTRLDGNSPAWSNIFGLCTVSEWIKSTGQLKTLEDTGNITSITWLFNGQSEWTFTSARANTTSYWRISDSEEKIVSANAYTSQNHIRPTFFLKGDTIISGTGTTDNPFKVEEDWAWFDFSAKQNVL